MGRSEGRQIDLWINGERRQIASGATLAGVVEELGLEADRVAVEYNREIARRSNWSSIVLAPEDRLEIVHFVGGG